MTVEPRIKYPRTAHLPTSPGASNDDVFTNAAVLAACKDVIVTEKLDGEGVSLYRDGLHARSIDSKHHPSRDWIKAMHATIQADIPSGMRICGESLYCKHSITYDSLPSYLTVFNIWRGDVCLAWDETVEWCELLELEMVPVLYRGPMLPLAELEQRWRDTLGPEISEGFVVRDAGSFARHEFGERVGKWVRPGHVQTDEHWMSQQVVPNRLRS